LMKEKPYTVLLILSLLSSVVFGFAVRLMEL